MIVAAERGPGGSAAADRFAAQPSALAGQFAGLSTSQLAAVMRVMFVAIIEEEKITANAAFKSLGPQGQGLAFWKAWLTIACC